DYYCDSWDSSGAHFF
nr:immunoglobulin light chain junction region [Macaca mulatta]MOV96314.1 immunoglobulin light chain junction region [Macaca mulatta]MOV97074.1 immunoglobulin light chain junction region [Macaca mulatta]MOV99892.1 immunoglobulin light chain junction region [Macaca mulatta]MOW01126.1 immunoglobulin light chain junction region [Macaca mulatta]